MDLESIIKKNKDNIKNIIKLVTKEENEDLEQEVYLKVWKNSDKYKEQGSLKSWVSTVAKNVSKDYLKSAVKKHEQVLTEDDDTTFVNLKDKKPAPELKLLQNERRKKILDAVNKLRPKFREVIIYCEIYGYSYEDCAKKFKCPLGTVKSRIYNAKKQLASELQDLI